MSSSKTPPSPRNASVIKKGLSFPAIKAVGWNWKNAMSLLVAPALTAIANPSPLATVGLVVLSQSCPHPPVAINTASPAIASISPESRLRHHMPLIPLLGSPWTLWIRSTPNVCDLNVIFSLFDTALLSALSISAPVASLACNILRAECPPSFTKWNSSPSFWKSTPIDSKSRILSPASSTTHRTISSSQSPSPHERVSSICACIASPSVLSRIPAIPPCAQLVDESSGLCLVIIITSWPDCSSLSAANRPAIPLPIMITLDIAARLAV